MYVCTGFSPKLNMCSDAMTSEDFVEIVCTAVKSFTKLGRVGSTRKLNRKRGIGH